MKDWLQIEVSFRKTIVSEQIGKCRKHHWSTVKLEKYTVKMKTEHTGVFNKTYCSQIQLVCYQQRTIPVEIFESWLKRPNGLTHNDVTKHTGALTHNLYHRAKGSTKHSGVLRGYF